jgi:glycosyltransferase involved in cell wall biosynthesis
MALFENLDNYGLWKVNILRDQGNRKKVLTIINKDLDTASTKFRVVQYLDYLKDRGVDFEFINRKAIDKLTYQRAATSDVVFNQKSLFNTSYAKKIISKAKYTIFDFDDAIYTRERRPYFWLTRLRVHKRLHLWLKNADIVTTANHFLAEYAHRYSGNVRVIPMSLDMDLWKPKGKISNGQITMGWAGAPVNIPLIEQLDHVFSHLLDKYSFLKLAIFSGKKPELSCPFDYYPFVPGKETSFIQNLDVGLLPLIDEEFYWGKSPIKAIQYLACGIPVVGNVIGATKEILNSENSISVSSEREWIKAFEGIIGARDRIQLMGRAGRAHVLLNHDFKKAAQLLYNTISKL